MNTNKQLYVIIMIVTVSASARADEPVWKPQFLQLAEKSKNDRDYSDLADRCCDYWIHRGQTWSMDAKIDLLIEAQILTARYDKSKSLTIADQMIDAIEPIHKKYLEDIPDKVSNRLSLLTKSRILNRIKGPTIFSGDSILVGKDSSDYFSYVYSANQLQWNTYGKLIDSALISRDGLPESKFTNISTNLWDSFVFSNGPIKLGSQLTTTVIVVDGDCNMVECSNSLLIINGAIKFVNKASTWDSFLIARDDITSKAPGLTKNSLMLAGGKISIPRSERKDLEHADGKQIEKYDFSKTGIKFFATSDVGLTLKAGEKDTVVITAIANDSPFAKDFVVGDLIAQVNDRKVKTPDECRRALRTAYVMEFGVVKAKRDGAAFEKTVYFPAPKPVELPKK